MQETIVFLIVACAACTVAGRYMPAALRHLVWKRISLMAHRLGWLRIATYAEKKCEAAPACATGCKQCNGCGTSAPQSGTVQFIALPARMHKAD